MSLTQEQIIRVEFLAVQLEDAVRRNDYPAVCDIINGLDLWTARAMLGGVASLAYGSKR